MHADDSTQRWRTKPPSVVAVLVAHRGSRWLPQTLASLDALSYRPNTTVLVHDNTDQATRDLLAANAHADRVVVSKDRTGFGAQVAHALESETEAYDWIWLLHDDAVCAPDALSALLDEATKDDSIGIVGPKIREWPSLRRLLEVGVTVTGTGHRETGLESGEPDAGQHDRAQDVLAVSTAGMLVRRDVWESLSGLDPHLPLFFDDIDFGWRANRAGYRVRTAPKAVLFHAEAARNRRRVRRGGIVEHSGERRAAALWTMLANADRHRFVLVSTRLLFGSLLRFVGFLFGKDLRSARGELVAIGHVFGKPGQMSRARGARKPLLRRSNRDLKDLFASFWMPYQHGLDLAASTVQTVVRPEEVETMGLRTLGEDGERDDPVVVELPPWWRRHPWLTCVLGLFAAALVAGRSVVGSPLTSDVLPPAAGSISQWWALLFERTHLVGLGSADQAPAYVNILSVLGVPLWFAPGLLTWLLIVFAVPAAALTAHRFGRLISDDRGARMTWAVSYGLLVVVTGAASGGYVGTIIALVILPLFANILLRLVLEPTWPPAITVGLLIAVVAAFAPVAWLLAMVTLGLCAFVARPAARQLALSALIGTVLLGPWLFDRVLSGRIWWEAGNPVDAPATALQVAGGSGGAIGATPAWIAIPLVVLAVAALIPPPTRRAVTVAWIVAVAGLVVGLAASVSTFTPYPGAPAVRAWAGLGAGLWLAGLMTAVLFAWPMLRTRKYRQWAKPAVVMLAIFPILAGGWWVVRGIDDPLQADPVQLVPAFLAAGNGTTVVLTGDSEAGIVADAVVGSGPFLGAEALRTTADREERLHDAVESLLTTPSSDDVEELAKLGVDHLYAPDVDLGLARRIDIAPGLTQKGSDSPSSRVWAITSDAEPEPLPTAGPLRPWISGGWLLLWLVVFVAALPVHRSTEEPQEAQEIE